MFFWKKKFFPKKNIFFLPFFNATFQCGRYGVFKKKFKYSFDPEKVKKWASKVAHNRPKPFFSKSSPAHSPKLIFHIINISQDSSVSLSVLKIVLALTRILCENIQRHVVKIICTALVWRFFFLILRIPFQLFADVVPNLRLLLIPA